MVAYRSIEESVDDLSQLREIMQRHIRRSGATRNEKDEISVHTMINHLIRDFSGLGEGFAHRVAAHPDDVQKVIEAPSTAHHSQWTGYGRSPWCWCTMPNGDLVLATYPQDYLYDAIKARIAMRGED